MPECSSVLAGLFYSLSLKTL